MRPSSVLRSGRPVALASPWIGGDPFVGRMRELELLRQLFQEACTGTGRTLCITGEPGIGKTRLLEHFVAILSELSPAALVARGRCLEVFGAGEAYWPFLEVLDGLMTGPMPSKARDLVRTSAPTWFLQFPSVVGSEEARQALQREALGTTAARMLREFVDALAAFSQEGPLVLVLEDLHWADASSIDLFRLPVGAAASTPGSSWGRFDPSKRNSTTHRSRAFI